MIDSHRRLPLVMRSPSCLLFLAIALLVQTVSSFIVVPRSQQPTQRWSYATMAIGLSSSSNDGNDVTTLQEYLQSNHAMFWKLLLANNADVWKQLSSSTEGLTIFAVTDEAMMSSSVGAQRIAQLEDIRNEEAVQRMGAFHCVNECVSAAELFESGGIMTLADVVPIERGVTGGLFGIGGKEDGSVTIGGRAKISESVAVEPKQIVHRVDAMVSPSILWRYCDQLRIPGSK